MTLQKNLAILLFILAAATASFGQESTCKAKWADLPAIPEFGGFRLGMSQDQVKARVPQVKYGHTDEFGVSKTTINPDFDPSIDKTHFGDMRSISLDFLDGSLSSIWIGFEGSFKWKTTEEFVKGISQELSLPEAWSSKGRNQLLKCQDFQLSIGVIAGGPSLRLLDTSAENTVAERRQAKEDAAETADGGETGASDRTAVVGDARKRIFYAADCESLKTIPEKSRISFNSDQEAEKAGFKRAGNCP
jgi:hypothetical protein